MQRTISKTSTISEEPTTFEYYYFYISRSRALFAFSKGTTIWFLWGGQEDLSEPENFFLPIFGAGEFFFAGPSGRIIFLKPPGAHFIKPWGGGVYTSMFLFLMQKVISKVSNIVLGLSKVVYGVRKANFGLRKVISDCERRFRTAKGRFWSAKTGFGVRKRFLRQAGEFFLPALRARQFFFSLKSEPEIFFAKSSCPPPP